MSDFLDLQGAKDLNTDAIHIKAVANSKNPVTGAAIDTHVNRKGGTDYTLQGFWNALGPVVMPWTSDTGGTLTQPNQAFLHPANGNYYSWTGAFPKAVAPGTNPTAVTGYVPRTDVVLRDELEVDGATISEISSAIPLLRYATPDNKCDIVLVYGQSNAVGFAGQPGVPAVDNYATPAPLSGAYNYDPATDSIVTISNTMNHLNYIDEGTASRGNAWTAFANEWISLTGRKCVVVNGARGGTSISQLSRGAGVGPKDYYQIMVDGNRSARDAMQRQGLEAGNTYLVFHQGETDMTLGTTFEAYKASLRQLFIDLKSDIPQLSKIGVCIVGCPSSRNQFDWDRIQSAQWQAVDNNENASVIYDGCPSFDLYSKQYNAADQTHYSQRGYNQMGKGAATGLFEWVGNKINSPGSSVRTDRSKLIAGTGYGSMQYVSGVAIVSGGSATLARKSNTTIQNAFYPCYIDKLLTDEVDANSLVFRTSGIAPVFYSYGINVPAELRQNGIYAVASRYNNGEVYGIRVRFYADLTFLVNTPTGAIIGQIPPAPGSFLSSIVSATAVGGVATITHPAITQTPNVSYYASSAMEFASASVRSDSATQTKVATDGSNNQVLVCMKNVPLTRAQAFLFNFEIHVNAMISSSHSLQAVS